MSFFDEVSIERLQQRRSVKWRRHPADVLSAWVAEMDFGAPPVVREALLEAIEREDYGYPLADAETGVPEAVAGWMRDRYGWDVRPERVFLVPDVLKGIELAIETFSPAGSPVVVPTPTYAPFFEVVRICGRELVGIPLLGEGRMDLNRIEQALIAGARTVLISNPQNPTGRVYSAAELAALTDLTQRHDARLVSDDVHAPLTFPGFQHVPAARGCEQVITITAASKAWNLAGLKCAQVVLADDADAELWRGLPALKTHGVTTLGIAATVAAYTSGGPWLDELVAYLEVNRQLIGKLLPPGIGYRPPEATYLAWLDCAQLGISDPMMFFREQARVAVTTGVHFGPGGEGYVRLNFGTSAALLTRILEAMGDALRRRP